MMGNIWGAIIGGALGGAKGMTVDKDKERRDRYLASETARYSPWTGMKPGAIKEANVLGSMMQGASTGASLGGQFGGGGGGEAADAGGGAEAAEAVPGQDTGNMTLADPDASMDANAYFDRKNPYTSYGDDNDLYALMDQDNDLKKFGYQGYGPNKSHWLAQGEK